MNAEEHLRRLRCHGANPRGAGLPSEPPICHICDGVIGSDCTCALTVVDLTPDDHEHKAGGPVGCHHCREMTAEAQP